MNREPGYGSCRRVESRDEARAFSHDLENAGTTTAGVSHISHSPSGDNREFSENRISFTADPQHQPDRTVHLLKRPDKLTCYRQGWRRLQR